MKRAVTSIIALVGFFIISASASAQEYTLWNISDFQAGTFTSIAKTKGLMIAGSPRKPIVVDMDNKRYDKMRFTQRLKLGGPGTAQGRFLSFKVNGDCTITVYGMLCEEKDSTCMLRLAANGMTKTNVLKEDLLESNGKEMVKGTYEYKGRSTNMFLYSLNGGFNIYAIEVESKK